MVGGVEAGGVDAVVGGEGDVEQVSIAHGPCMSTQHNTT